MTDTGSGEGIDTRGRPILQGMVRGLLPLYILELLSREASHGTGIATELLRRLIEVARSRRLERLEGIVLRENKGMLKLAGQLGFDQHPVAEDQQLLRVTLDL